MGGVTKNCYIPDCDADFPERCYQIGTCAELEELSGKHYIKEAEVKAIDKDRFNKYKESCIKKLELKRKVVADEGVVTYSLCNDVLANLNDLRGYDRVISKKDMDCINEKREELMKISKELNGQKKDNLEDSQKFDVIVSDILNILKKGEYAL